jgi:3-deoxy-D-manno-octulosonic-acid transferase
MSELARGAYSLLLRLLQPVYALRLWRRGRVEPLYRHAIAERFGIYTAAAAGTGWIWVHAVSLGETRAAAALVDALRAEFPGMKLLLTHGTATGREAGVPLLRAGDAQVWLPYDTPSATRRFIARFRPAVGVLMETEVWPNLLHAAQQGGVPVVLANARLSARSLRRGQRLDALMRPAAQRITLALAQTEADAQRLREAGAPQVEVSGNLKFDMTPDPALLALGRSWRASMGRDVLLAASTREGEEAMLMAAWARAPAPRPLLLIVPRHPQRFDEVAALIRGAGLSLARRSSWGDAPSVEALKAEVWLGDSMREMALYYALAQAALLGGSFAPLGGQNLIEAAACGCPVVTGPHTFNFAEASELAIQAGAALRVTDMASGVTTALDLLASPQRCEQASAHALAFAAQHQGAALRMARRIVSVGYINPPPT